MSALSVVLLHYSNMGYMRLRCPETRQRSQDDTMLERYRADLSWFEELRRHGHWMMSYRRISPLLYIGLSRFLTNRNG